MSQPVKVLLVEDNRIEAHRIQQWLCQAGNGVFVVECVEKLTLGLHRLTKGGIDIVLLDLNLSDSRGIETFVKLHQEIPDVPIVVLTGEYDDAIGPSAVEKGAQDYLVKQDADGPALSHILLYSLVRHRANQEQFAIERRHRQAELLTAVQKQMLPLARPNTPGYDFWDYYRAAENVGGDYFGYSRLSDDRIAITIADVCGKGIRAALMVAELSSEVRHCLETSSGADIAMSRLNRQFCGRDTFITFLLCVVDPHQHTLTVVNAGHAPPIRRVAASGISEQLPLSETALPLGIMPDEAYVAEVFDIDSGDLFVLYTDGITEVRGEANDLFGNDRLIDSLRRTSAATEKTVRSLIHDVEVFRGTRPQSDDMCLVCFKRCGENLERSHRHELEYAC